MRVCIGLIAAAISVQDSRRKYVHYQLPERLELGNQLRRDEENLGPQRDKDADEDLYMEDVVEELLGVTEWLALAVLVVVIATIAVVATVFW